MTAQSKNNDNSPKPDQSELQARVDAMAATMAAIEFEPDGTILSANDIFLQAMECTLDDIVGKHHRIFVAEDFAGSDEYKRFWRDLGSGTFQAGEFERRTFAGNLIWIEGRYSPLRDEDGKVFKVVKYAADITERKQSEADAVEAAAQIAAMAESSAMIAFEPDGTIITANQIFCEAMNCSLESIVGEHHRIFVEAEYGKSGEYARFWRDLGRGESKAGEFERRKLGGEPIWIEGRYSPLRNSAGEVFKVVKYASDITARKQAEAKAYEDTAQINAMAQSMAMIQFEPDGTIITANEIFCNAMRCRLEDIVGRHHRIFVEPAYGASAEYADFWRDLGSGREKSGEFERRKLDGEVIWIEGRYSPLRDADGNVFKVVKYASDVTERKGFENDAVEAAAQIQAMSESSAMIAFEPDGTIVTANDLFLSAMNCSLSQIVGQHHRMFVESSYGASDEYVQFWRDLGNGIHKGGQFERRKVTGETIWIEGRYSPLRDSDGKVFRVVKYASDITAQKQSQQEQELATETVERLVQASRSGRLCERGDLGDLGEGRAHELVSSVNAMLDAIEAPINEVSEVLASLADKKLSVRMVGEYEGSLEKIKQDANRAIDNLETAMAQVGGVSSQVGNASSQISQGSIKLADGASTQASSIEEISASLEEMSSMTSQNADNAQQAKSLAESAKGSADRGDQQMLKMKEAIDLIKSSSDETAKIVKTIDEISFQTNMLALNAAVEAARAGDAGKGFAVVAEEVRSLAQRSAEAAKSTAELIEGSARNVENGVGLTESVQGLLSEINEGSNRVTDLITEIAAASKEQAEGIGQVTEAIDQMNRVTQENAASSEESSAAATELNGQVAELMELIGQFEVDRSQVVSQTTSALPSGAAPAPARPVAERRPASARQRVIPLGDDGMADF